MLPRRAGVDCFGHDDQRLRMDRDQQCDVAVDQQREQRHWQRDGHVCGGGQHGHELTHRNADDAGQTLTVTRPPRVRYPVSPTTQSIVPGGGTAPLR